MAGTIILDASFLVWLREFDRYCRKHAEELHLTDEEMPLRTLDFLMSKGCSMVIPNEVLKEVVQKGDGQCVGLTSDGNGNVSLNIEPIRSYLSAGPIKSKYIIRSWLTEKYDQGKITTFPSFKAYFNHTAKAAEGIEGHVCIVPERHPEKTSGLQPKLPKGAGRGDAEIKQIGQRINNNPAPLPYFLTLTHDADILRTVNRGRFMAMGSAGFLQLLARSGFPADLQTASESFGNIHKREGSGKFRSAERAIMEKFLGSAQLVSGWER